MTRPSLAAALLLTPTVALAGVPALCTDAPNEMEARFCVGRALDAAEADLARARAALAGKLDAVGRRNLDRAQAAWTAYRALECDLETGYDTEHLGENGAIAPRLVGECAVDLTRRRTAELRDQLKCPGGDLSCPP